MRQAASAALKVSPFVRTHYHQSNGCVAFLLLLAFARLELEAGARVVREKNTVTWLVAGG